MTRILYSCMGTTDPVRGMRDGGLMHIMRHYRPDAVYLFLSAEIAAMARKDSRIDKMFSFMRENWDGYAPHVVCRETEISDPSDLDALAGPMEELLRQIRAENPEAEILMNLSSGTPQMEILMVQMTQDPRYTNIRGIQIKNPERKSGTETRTNARDFSAEDALAMNLDEEANQPNRCVEPRLMAVRRDEVRKKLQNFVAQRNYAAIAGMGADLPAPYRKLAEHLDYRSRFLLKDAEEAAKGLTFKGLKLQAKMPDDQFQKREYRLVEMLEYFAMLKHLSYLKRYTEFGLRLNPFLIRLQITLLDELVKPLGFREWGLLSGPDTRKRVDPVKIGQRDLALLAALEARFEGPIDERDVSIQALNVMLKHYGLAEAEMQLLEECEKVNTELRNYAAHRFFTITDETIVSLCGKGADQLLRGLEKQLLRVTEDCGAWGPEQRLNVYANCDKLLLTCL